MPKRTDIEHILIIGSGPIIIGQACEFDYSGTQACKALREEGFKVTLVNSNPATIMTDPETADRTYVEPITVESLTKIIALERPQAILPTLGGQTALNTAMGLHKAGVLEKYGVELIGANFEAINRAEERDLFKATMESIGVECLISRPVHTLQEAEEAAGVIGFPIIVRPSYTLGGTGGGIARDMDELRRIVAGGLKASLSTEVLLEESVYGWKEFEMEVMRDRKDNTVIVCSIENLDPMGIHTGDSITVAPAQTLTDREYQAMRDASIKIMRAIGVETGGSNVQFCIHPETGRLAVIEMNPRVSRSSALASKATGFPIAKLAAKLAVGYTLDELPNDITRETPACFEPAIDYCVVKVPRFAFEKFPTADTTLGVSMKSVGETMAIGRNFREALQKAYRSLEIGADGLDLKAEQRVPKDRIKETLEASSVDRCIAVKCALKRGFTPEEIYRMTSIDPWFIDQILQIIEVERELIAAPRDVPPAPELLRRAKRDGFSDEQISKLTGRTFSALEIRAHRKAAGIVPVYRLVDTCAGEFEAYTPYFFSTYGELDETRRSDRPKVMILGSGPNRIGQGIEFDYSCVHTVQALQELGYETIMVNSNPETVSTDYDTADKLYFEPLTFEDVMNIVESERPDGVIIQMGGQTPLNLAMALMEADVPIMGTSPANIDIAEDRERCRLLLDRLGLRQPPSATAKSMEEAMEAALRIGFPVMIRPSYVLGGRAMMVARNAEELVPFVYAAFAASPGHPVLIDCYLENAVEMDVDLVCDGTDVYVGGVMQHVEAAGVHSGDSACALPPYSVDPGTVQVITEACGRIALELGVRGLMNAQVAVKDGECYILEVNPRASRTVPFVSKATQVPLAKVAAKVAAGKTLKELGLVGYVPRMSWFSVKEAVFPFDRFAGVDPILGPEMKSTGEVMGIDPTFEGAYWKSQVAAGQILPLEGVVFLSARDEDKPWIVEIGRQLTGMGFSLAATSGTAQTLEAAGLPVDVMHKLAEGAHPNVIDRMQENRVALIINTPSGPVSRMDEIRIRSEAILRRIPIVTTQSGAEATIRAIRFRRESDWQVRPLQDYILDQDG